MTDPREQRRLAAILAADVVAYSRLMGVDEAGTLAALRARWRDVLTPSVARHKGRVVKVMGDGVLVEFGSAVDAVECAVALQAGFAGANEGVPEDRRVVLRIGINLGEVIVQGGDIYGDGVNIAARLEALAEPGGIVVSAKVQAEVQGKVDAAFDDLGEVALKNIATPLRVYRIAPSAGSAEVHSAGRPVPALASIAVLPFENMSGDPDQDYFADGVAEDVLTELSRFRSLFVIARNSSFSFRDKGLAVQDIARRLNVQFVLSGSVRRAGKRVRVSVRLTQGSTGQDVWAERYDREVEDIFAVQDDIVRTIVVTLQARLGMVIAAEASRRKTPNLAAHECVLLAVRHINRHDFSAAEPYVRQALQIDPENATAHLAQSSLAYVAFLETFDPKALDRMEAAARRAVSLDPLDSGGHARIGMALTARGALSEAAPHVMHAVQLNPADTVALAYQAEWLLRSGDAVAAMAVMDQLLLRDPISPPWHWEILAFCHILVHRYHEAIIALGQQDRKFWYIYGYLAVCHSQLGQAEKAKAEIAELLNLKPGMTVATLLSTAFPEANEGLEVWADGLRLAGLPD